MRTAWENERYIVNVTRQFVGQANIFRLKADACRIKPHVLFFALEQELTSRLKKVGFDTLGRICAYGTSKGFHNGGPLAQAVGFMNLTGFTHVVHHDFERKKGGPDLLVEMAVSTIVCVAFDIINQGHYSRCRDQELGEDALYLHHM